MNQHVLFQVVSALSTALQVRDFYTSNHQNKVSNLARLIAQELNLPEDQVEQVRLAATLHDIGKLGVPTAILSKAGKLREEEFDLIKLHSVIGEEILQHIEFGFPLPKMVRQHHERLDGSGYPDGLVGNEILLGARIISVADVVDSMSSSRAYRGALGVSAAIDEITKNSGILYDPDVVDACCRLYKEGRIDDLNSKEVWGKYRGKKA